jgi:hypothetical protein
MVLAYVLGAALTCLNFNGRLGTGESFRHALPSGFEFRLLYSESQILNQWSIIVGPRNDPDADFMWVVSPPWMQHPHRILGASYGLDVRHAMGIDRRGLRFVLNEKDYNLAVDIERRFQNGQETERVEERLARLPRGTLDLYVLDYQVRKNFKGDETNFIERVRFRVRACVPPS